jgi:hypothetical protein
VCNVGEPKQTSPAGAWDRPESFEQSLTLF